MANDRTRVNSILEGLDRTSAEWKSFWGDVLKDPTNKKLQQIASKYGYEMKPAYLNEWGFTNINIYTKGNSRFKPKVYFDLDMDGDLNKSKWEIQTTSYGSLGEKEYAEFLKCCTDAYNMIKEIGKVDLTKLPQEPSAK